MVGLLVRGFVGLVVVRWSLEQVLNERIISYG